MCLGEGGGDLRVCMSVDVRLRLYKSVWECVCECLFRSSARLCLEWTESHIHCCVLSVLSGFAMLS